MEVIITHTNADFDALACVVAARKLYPEAIAVLPTGLDRNVREFYTLHQDLLGLVQPRDVEQDAVTRLIVVETRQAKRLGEFQRVAEDPTVELHVYDHHPSMSGDLRGMVNRVMEYGAGVTMFVEIFQERQIAIDPLEATVLALGLYEDTGAFTFSATTPQDLEAGSFLLEHGANLDIVSHYIQRPLDPDQRKLLNDLILSTEYLAIGGIRIALATARTDTYVGELALLTHKLRDIENVDAVFSIAQMEETTYLVARSKADFLNVGLLLQRIGGGGHSRASSAAFRGKTVEQVKSLLLEALSRSIRPEIVARQIMSFPVRTVAPNDSIEKAGDLMTRYGYSGLLVVEDGKVVGTLDSHDVDKAFHHQLTHAPVKAFLSPRVVSISPETTLSEIERLLTQEEMARLPVFKNGCLVGIVTRTDFLRARYGGRYARSRAEIECRPDLTDSLRVQLPEMIFRLLERIGQTAEEMGTQAYVVGGFVRDLLLGRPNLDTDILVERAGDRFAQALARELRARLKVHRRFGTASLTLPDGFKLDVATARAESYRHPAALPDVEPEVPVEEDLKRRDFTMNAMAIRLNPPFFGELVDPFGGRFDLKARTLRTLHKFSFVEDPTRIFRAVRFEGRFGFRLEEPMEESARWVAASRLIERLSGKRLRTELLMILEMPSAASILKRLDELDILKHLHPALGWSKAMERRMERVAKAISWMRALVPEESFQEWLVRFLGWAGEMSAQEVVRYARDRLRMPSDHVEILEAARDHTRRFLNHLASSGCESVCIYEILKGLPLEGLVYARAEGNSPEVDRAIARFLKELRYIRLEISGDDLIALGFHEGPAIGRALRETLRAKLEGRLQDRQAELEYAIKQVQTS